jgi:hypothetical protein
MTGMLCDLADSPGKVLPDVAMSPHQPPDIPRVMEIAKESGLEILPPCGANLR